MAKTEDQLRAMIEINKKLLDLIAGTIPKSTPVPAKPVQKKPPFTKPKTTEVK